MYSSIQFADIDVKKLTLLTNYTEYEQKLLIEEAVKGLLLFYVIFDCGKPIALDNGEVERIRLNHPEEVYLNFQSTNEYDDNIENKIQYVEKYSWGSIWLESETVDEYLNIPNKLSYSSPYVNILLMAEKKFWQNLDPNKPPRSEEIVSYLVREHKVSIKIARAIDSIIRPEKYRKGGTVKQNKI